MGWNGRGWRGGEVINITLFVLVKEEGREPMIFLCGLGGDERGVNHKFTTIPSYISS